MSNHPQVIAVGAGPVGLTMAIDLGRRGIRTLLIEQKAAPQFLPKMERCNSRTMEMYRRIGIADRIREVGLRSDIPMDVYVILSMIERPLLRLPYPSVDEARRELASSNNGNLSCEPYQLISQYTLEPLLKSIAETFPSVNVRYGCEFLSLEQDPQGVVATVRSGSGQTENIRAQYLVGCDGGASPVRKQLGVKLRGEGNLLELRQALYYCEDLFDRIPLGHGPGRGRHYHVADDRSSFLIMQDSTRHFTLHAVVDSDEAMKAQFEAVVGAPIKYEMLSCNPWRQNLLLADRYQDGRVFLAGDAAHLVIPTGGLGMNTGVGDALDLSWKLAAALEGWAGDNILRSYEIERRLVGENNVGASRYASLGRRKWRSKYRPNIRDNTLEGEATRKSLATIADIEQRKTNEMIGAELGYRYISSPIIDDLPGGPEHYFREYHPTTWPGARLPHVWLSDGAPIQDHIPDNGFTLIRLGGVEADNSKLIEALRSYGAPARAIDIPDAVARDVYGYDFVLVRPDLHIVWRGNKPHDDVAALAARATGHW